MNVSPEAPDDRMNRLFGLILITAGGLMATLCGLCSGGVFVLIVLQSSTSDPSLIFGAMLIFGIAPMVLGIVIFRAGQRMYRRASAMLQETTPPDPA
jgi:hypothetical protein